MNTLLTADLTRYLVEPSADTGHENERVLLLVPTTTYRIGDFLDAAARLEIEVAVGSDQKHVLEEFSDGGTVTIDFENIEHGTSQILEYADKYPLKAIIGIDDETTLLAAKACQILGLRGSDPDAVESTRNKYLFRTRLANSGLQTPSFFLVQIDDDPFEAARRSNYPVVLKPLALSASRGVIRANNEEEFAAALKRIRAILKQSNLGEENAKNILVESYIPGQEVALEGILEYGKLQVLALFDKPDPLEGPFFEETIFVTPSRLPDQLQKEIHTTVESAAFHLGLREGAIHAELRINEVGVWLIEVAARSIGGNCARTLQFGAGARLEDVILRHAIGIDCQVANFRNESVATFEPNNKATGVMMIPIPTAGQLCNVEGIEAARNIEGIEDVTINIAIGQVLVPVPEGHRYLGFIFAKSATPEALEANLRKAHEQLSFIIEPIVPNSS